MVIDDPKKSDKEIVALEKNESFFFILFSTSFQTFPDILMCDNHDLDRKIKGLLWNSIIKDMEFHSGTNQIQKILISQKTYLTLLVPRFFLNFHQFS